MAKSALGRGLQHLMKERPAAVGPEQAAEKRSVTPGMAALLRGGNDRAEERQPADQPPVDLEILAASARKRKLIQATMIVADLILVLLVTRLAFISHGSFGFFEVVLCILALAIGAWLSCLALWMK
jgi:hypothetical protein